MHKIESCRFIYDYGAKIIISFYLANKNIKKTPNAPNFLLFDKWGRCS